MITAGLLAGYALLAATAGPKTEIRFGGSGAHEYIKRCSDTEPFTCGGTSTAQCNQFTYTSSSFRIVS